jgi:dihydroorotate dehydrogenase (NAD+) catalytic subunit
MLALPHPRSPHPHIPATYTVSEVDRSREPDNRELNGLSDDLPRYDPSRTYRWNYDHAPDPVKVDVPSVPGEWTFLGRCVASPLGIPAGPLLNGRWILYYASLGFDVLTYKTVRSRERECYPLPNLLPVETGPLRGHERDLPAAREMRGSWAVSFGMPSMAPDIWRADIEWTRGRLPAGKVLSVSVVGSVQPGWSIEQLADDYARCAHWAVDSGADFIETNFSCPNVSTCDGQLYQQPESAALVAARVREAIGATPFIAKLGHVTDRAAAAALLDALAPHVSALAMTNSVAATVRAADGAPFFEGQPRGVCGEATRSASIEQVRLFAGLIAERHHAISLIGVGGASTADHVRAYLDAGAASVHIATAAMLDPLVAVRIRRGLQA